MFLNTRILASMAWIAQHDHHRRKSNGLLTHTWHQINIRPVVLVRQGVAIIGFLSRERTIAGPGFNRWLIPPAALMVHLSIGEIYAFSVFKNPLVERFGTGLTPIAIIFSIGIVMLGLSAAVFGTWVERAGPRAAMFTAALCWSGGFVVAALGVATTQLWLVYLGYGVLGGIGLGIGYISPVSTLIKWFPDRPGLATGLAIMGFGGGAHRLAALQHVARGLRQ
jgi:MFS family permease